MKCSYKQFKKTYKRKNYLDFLLLDTSFKSEYCSYKSSDETAALQNQKEKVDLFSAVIEEIALQLPTFEGNYENFENYYSIVEYCAQGQILKKLVNQDPAEFKRCFDSEKLIDEVVRQQSPQSIKKFDAILQGILSKLSHYCNKHLDPSTIITEATKKMDKYSFHENVEGIKHDMNKWLEDLKINGKKSLYFKELCLGLSWRLLIEHDFKNREKCNYLLMGYYLGSRRIINIEGAILFEKFAGATKISFRENEELLDPYILEVLCMAHLNVKTKVRRTVSVLTLEKKFENQLDMYIKRALAIEQKIKESKFLKKRAFQFKPGYLIIVGAKNSNKKPLVISVKDRIELLRKEREQKLKKG